MRNIQWDFPLKIDLGIQSIFMHSSKVLYFHLTLEVSHLDISGKDINDIQFLNKLFMVLTL